MHSNQQWNFPYTSSDANNSTTAELKLDNNPAYETRTPLQTNVGYENTTFTAGKSEESQAITNSAEPDYETVTVISSQPASPTTQITSSSGEDGYNKLNRDAVISSQPASATTQITTSSGEEDSYNKLNSDTESAEVTQSQWVISSQ